MPARCAGREPSASKPWSPVASTPVSGGPAQTWRRHPPLLFQWRQPSPHTFSSPEFSVHSQRAPARPFWRNLPCLPLLLSITMTSRALRHQKAKLPKSLQRVSASETQRLRFLVRRHAGQYNVSDRWTYLAFSARRFHRCWRLQFQHATTAKLATLFGGPTTRSPCWRAGMPDTERLTRKLERRKASLADLCQLYRASSKLPGIAVALAAHQGPHANTLLARCLVSSHISFLSDLRFVSARQEGPLNPKSTRKLPGPTRRRPACPVLCCFSRVCLM